MEIRIQENSPPTRALAVVVPGNYMALRPWLPELPVAMASRLPISLSTPPLYFSGPQNSLQHGAYLCSSK
jgi:hypothetical protein